MIATTERNQASSFYSSDPNNHGQEEKVELIMPEPPDGGWGWVVVFCSFMIHVVADGVTFTFGIFYMEFLRYFGESKGLTSWVVSIMVGTTFCVGPLASGLTNQFGCRTVTIVGSLLASFGLIISTIAPNIIFLYFSVGICTGAGFGLMYVPAIVSVTCYFEKKRAFATGIAVCGSGIGTLLLAPITEWMVSELGWKGAMLITAGFVLNCCVFGALFRPLEKKPVVRSMTVYTVPGLPTNGDLRKRTVRSKDAKENSQFATSKKFIFSCPIEIRKSFKEMMNFRLMRNTIFLIYSFAKFFTDIGFYVPLVYTKDRAVSLKLANDKYASFLLSIIGLTSTLGRVLSGYLSDRNCINRFWLYSTSYIVSGIATVFSSFCLDYNLMALYAAIFGTTSGVSISLTSVILVDLLGLEKMTNAFGLLLLFEGISSFVGPPITAWLHDYTGSYDPGFYVAGAVIAFSGIMLFFIPYVQHSQEKSIKKKSEGTAIRFICSEKEIE